MSRVVRDLREAIDFYGATLGLAHLYTFGDLAFFDCGGVRLFLRERGRDEAVGEESILYFRVPDIQEAHRSLGARGVAFVQEPRVIHTHDDGRQEWMAFFEDPEGRPLALMA